MIEDKQKLRSLPSDSEKLTRGPGQKRVELLCPGGTLEKLKIAIRYGADACYIAGMNYGLRTRAGNFTRQEMEEALAFAHSHNAKIYVVANMVTHEGDEAGVEDFFREIYDLGVDAVLISDPGLIAICQAVTPNLPIHLSTQASAINYEALNFWHSQGLERVVLGREVSLEEIREMKAKTEIEIESFIHGAMCVGYSGRCVLSNHLKFRDGNRGGCAQPCRWAFELFDLDPDADSASFRADLSSKSGDQADGDKQPFYISAADLSMIEHIPELIESGVDSLKIEGRMKSIHYVSTVANVYRKALNSYYEDPEHYEVQQEWIDELEKVAQRNLSTGFYFGKPGVNEQSYKDTEESHLQIFIGQVLAYDPDTGIATIEQRNKFEVGDQIEFYGPGFRHHIQRVEWMENEEGERIDSCPHPQMILRMPVVKPVKRYDLIRKIFPEDDLNA